MKKDTVFSKPTDEVEAFRFDARVADVFDNMINRSVPGYRSTLDMVGVFTRRYAVAGTNCYDLGCSLGAATLTMRRHLPASCRLVAVDNAPAMIERCQANLVQDDMAVAVDIREEDIRQTNIENASVVVMNYTLQFVPDDDRPALLRRIADGMIEGGALIVSEKIRLEDAEEQRLLTRLHEEFKRDQGYSDLEISAKRTALEDVLIPNSPSQHLARFRRAGFSSARLCVQCLNFATFLAIR